MPTLGFLKKNLKRGTKEGNKEASASQPTSPEKGETGAAGGVGGGAGGGGVLEQGDSHSTDNTTTTTTTTTAEHQSSPASASASASSRPVSGVVENGFTPAKDQPPQHSMTEVAASSLPPAVAIASNTPVAESATSTTSEQSIATTTGNGNGNGNGIAHPPPQHDGAGQSLPVGATESSTPATEMKSKVDSAYASSSNPDETQTNRTYQEPTTRTIHPQVLHSHPIQMPQPSSQPQQTNTSTTVRQTKGKYSLADFSILRTLGTGSFGRVHLVQSKHNSRFYAVKVLKKAQVIKMKQVEHTNDERRMLQEVKHPFLITLWGTFTDARNLYMVMDFVEGGELFSLLRKSQRFPNPVAKFYAAEVTLALEYLHSKQIIYRDLKPENLLLDRHGHLKITDFGFAKKVPDITWTLCGTPDYLAPEVVSSKGYNKSVDWWSLGILIFEMLCGFTPFWDQGSPMKIYENILKGRVRYPPYIHPDAQDLLQRLITADLTKRLGNLHGGSDDVKGHAWFAEVTWERLAKKDIDAPYVPPVKAGVGDASQFDKYPEETEQYGQNGVDEYGHMFLEF